MTVEELIEQLKKLPPDLTVEAEGCDCINKVRSAGVFELKGPRGTERGCILVCEPDFYGVLGPAPEERRRLRREEQAREQAPQAGGEGES